MSTTQPDAEKKERYWGAERNARRRERYENDPEYRERQRAQRRESRSRRINGSDAAAPRTCLPNLSKVDTSGAQVAVSYNGGTLVIGRVFTQADVSELLDRHAQVFYRWRQRDIFPAPVLQDDKGNLYYSDQEATAFVRIMGEHQQATPHYRSDHVEVRDRLYAASFEKNSSSAQAWIHRHR